MRWLDLGVKKKGSELLCEVLNIQNDENDRGVEE